MTLDCQLNNANAFGEKIPPITTSSGHYAIPIKKAKQVITKQYSATAPEMTTSLTPNLKTACSKTPVSIGPSKQGQTTPTN